MCGLRINKVFNVIFYVVRELLKRKMFSKVNFNSHYCSFYSILGEKGGGSKGVVAYVHKGLHYPSHLRLQDIKGNMGYVEGFA